MIPITYKNNSKFLIIGTCGIVMALLGFLIYTFEPIDAFVQSMVTMSPYSILYRLWVEPPFEVFINIRIFNITNPEQFLSGEEKINLQEIGPYVYQEELFNENSEFNDNGTITFTPKRKLTFRPDKSVGTLDDIVLCANIPLLGITSHLRDAGFFVNLALAQIANMLDSQAFLHLTVEQYLWGYDDRLVDLANKAIPSWINFPRFGIMDRLYALDNDTNVVTIRGDHPSNKPYEQPYSIEKFNGYSGLDHWGYTDQSPDCGSLSGRYVEGIFPRNLNTNVTIGLYRRAFCREVPFNFEEYSVTAGFETLTYRVDPLFLATKEERPENSCYCIKGVCPKKGVNSVSPCYYGIPITISQPHYLNADASLSDMVTGLTPNVENHDSVFKIDKNIGIPLSAALRIQINLDIDTKFSSRCRPFNGLSLPLFWIELQVADIPHSVEFVLFFIQNVLPIAKHILIWGLLLFGIAMVAIAALFTLFGPSNYGLEDPFANGVGYSPIRIIPMSPPVIRISK